MVWQGGKVCGFFLLADIVARVAEWQTQQT